jgi:hypothetical protein
MKNQFDYQEMSPYIQNKGKKITKILEYKNSQSDYNKWFVKAEYVGLLGATFWDYFEFDNAQFCKENGNLTFTR